jgi:cytochrome c553
MKSFRLRVVGAGVVLLAFVVTICAGGWAVVSLSSLPEYFVAAKPVTLTFFVRQHGVTLVDGLAVALSATETSGASVKGVVAPTGNHGEYKAAFTLPQAGNWTVKIDSGLGVSTLLPTKAIAANDATPQLLSAVARGERLFAAKGCTGCHVNQEVAVPNLVSVGPELTGRKFPMDFLKNFLADPTETKKKISQKSEMPNLNLSADDIDALAAFLNRDRAATASAEVR